VSWPDLGYADNYLRSYETFAGLRGQGVIRAGVRFQVEYPTPVNFVSFTVPQYQREESYFAPLADLAADPGAELNFGIVPYYPAQQAPGTRPAR